MNVLTSIGRDMEVAGEDVLHGIEFIGRAAEHTLAVLTSANKFGPAFKTELSTLVGDAEAIGAAIAPALIASGGNVSADVTAVLAALPTIRKLVSDITGFLPTLKAAVAELESSTK